jgi:hypothetical protein
VCGEREYVRAWKTFLKQDFRDPMWVTMNVPNERSTGRPQGFYPNLWTRAAEAELLGPRTLKLTDLARRIVWLMCREVAADGMIHYHAVVRFPADCRFRDGRLLTELSVAERVKRLEQALENASRRTPEVFAGRYRHIHVEQLHDNSAAYLFKAMRWPSLRADPEKQSGELLRDSGLIILPHIGAAGLSRRANIAPESPQ